MPGIINTGTLPKALWPGINAWWGAYYKEHPEECRDLFEFNSSNQNYEEDVQNTGFGLAPVKTEGGGIQYDDVTQGIVSRYTNIVYGLGFIVTREEIEDNLYMKVAKSRTKSLAFSIRQTKENVGANVYNRAFNTNFTMDPGDGQPLISTAHTSRAGAWSNQLNPNADFSEAALEDLTIQIMGATDDRGLKISLMAQSLHIPRQLYYEAIRVLESVLQNDTANNATNAVRNSPMVPGGAIVNHYFTDTDAWFLRTNCPDGMKAFQRRETQFTEDNDFDTENAKYKATERYVFGWTDPRGIYGTAGS